MEPKGDYSIHRNMLLDPIVSQFIPVHIHTS